MSPGWIAGNRGSVAASDQVMAAGRSPPAGGVSGRRRTVALWAPARGAEIDSTMAVHGPDPPGRSAGGTADPPLATSNRTVIAIAPIDAGPTLTRSRRRLGNRCA